MIRLPNYLMPAACIAALVFAGCKEQPAPQASAATAPEAQAATEENPITGQDVAENIGEAVDTTVAYTAQQKDQFIAASEEKLAQLKEKMAQLKDDTSGKASQLKADLQAKYDQAAGKLEELKQSGGEVWGEVRNGFVHAYDELETATKSAIQKMKGE